MSKPKVSANYSASAKTATRKVQAPVLAYAPPQPKRLRKGIALIGCGGITAFHLRAYRKAGWRVDALLDLDPHRAEARQKEFFPRAKVCHSMKELLELPEIQVVDIATHPSERVKLIETSIKAGKHVLSQKPFVLDLKTGRRLVRMAREHNVWLAVNQNGRWAPHFSYLRQAVRKGILGPLGSVATSVSWDHTWTKGTAFERIRHLLLYDFGIHWFDMVSRVFADRRALRVNAFVDQAHGQPIAPPLLATISVHYENGIASLSFNGHSRAGNLDVTVATGGKGILHCQGPGFNKQKVRLLNARGEAAVPLRGSWFVEGFQGAMGELLCAIEKRHAPDHDAENNLDGLALCFAAIESAATGRPQTPGKILRAPAGCEPGKPQSAA